jgi:hypothetical protein
MSAVATSPTRIIKRVSRWSQPGHGDARSDSCPAALGTAPSFSKAPIIGAQASPRATGARHQLPTTLSRPASAGNTAIKSP